MTVVTGKKLPLVHRVLLLFVAILWAGSALNVIHAQVAGSTPVHETSPANISPVEDLMREHGLLNRLLLVYEELARRLEKNENQLSKVHRTATLVQNFVENYHEKLEENYIFPIFEKQNKHVALVKTLREQHAAGRAITAKLKAITRSGRNKRRTRKKAVTLIKQFVRMYRPHEAREDTVLFPLVQSLMSEHEYAELGEKFEDIEHELFGEDGFFGIVKHVENIEKELGIYSLEQFTPRLK